MASKSLFCMATSTPARPSHAQIRVNLKAIPIRSRRRPDDESRGGFYLANRLDFGLLLFRNRPHDFGYSYAYFSARGCVRFMKADNVSHEGNGNKHKKLTPIAPHKSADVRNNFPWCK